MESAIHFPFLIWRSFISFICVLPFPQPLCSHRPSSVFQCDSILPRSPSFFSLFSFSFQQDYVKKLKLQIWLGSILQSKDRPPRLKAIFFKHSIGFPPRWLCHTQWCFCLYIPIKFSAITMTKLGILHAKTQASFLMSCQLERPNDISHHGNSLLNSYQDTFHEILPIL